MELERYKELDLIGEGSYGYVKKCTDCKTGCMVAVKYVRIDPEDRGIPPAILRETSTLKSLDHENVLRLLDVEYRDEGFYFVFEYLELDLMTFINERSMTEVNPRRTKDILFQILRGVSYCCFQKELHGHLTPHNLLIDLESKRVKIADFGFARNIEVTPFSYRAPEILLQVPYSGAVDIWAVGCIFAEMVIKHPFFSGSDPEDVMIQICRMHGLDTPSKEEAGAALLEISEITKDIFNNKPCKELLSEASKYIADRLNNKLEQEGLDLLSKMLRVDTDRRITAIEALNHPYFKDPQLNLYPRDRLERIIW